VHITYMHVEVTLLTKHVTTDGTAVLLEQCSVCRSRVSVHVHAQTLLLGKRLTCSE